MSQMQDQQTYKRAANAALIGLIVQLGLSIGVALLGVYAQSVAIHAATWYFFGGLPIWACLLVLYHQHRLERIEALEAEQLARADARTAAIFDEAGQQLQLARQRLERMHKFGLPIVSTIVAAYLLIVGLVLLSANWALVGGEQPAATVIGNPYTNAGVLALLLAVLGFVAFLVSRYVSGMTQVKEWMLLRGGASYLMGNFVVALLLVAGAAFAVFHNYSVMAVMAAAVPVLMVVLGVEMLIGFLLSIYRPRRPGEIMRPAFDSRVLGWLTRPESLGKIVSETLNYQFGFEISRSWFYQLLARAFTPLVVVGVLVLLGLSSLVIVPPHQQAVLTTFGGNMRIAEPGAHFKWPWPIGQAEMYDAYRVHELPVGSLVGALAHREITLWDREHPEGEEEYLLTAPSRAFEDLGGDTVSGELIGAQLIVNYRINDLAQYVRAAGEPVRLLEQVAGREINTYFAMHDIDTLLSQNRLTAGGELRRRMQAQLDSIEVPAGIGENRRGLGLEVVFVAIVDIHPPREADVADKFHEQIGAVQRRQTAIEDARRHAIGTLAEVAGSASGAQVLRELIEDLQDLENQMERLHQARGDDPMLQEQELTDEQQQLRQRIVEQQVRIEQALDELRGEAAQEIHEARAHRWARVLTEQGRATRFEAQLLAFDRAPQYFRMRHYLATLGQGLSDRRKIIMASDKEEPPVIRMNLESTEAGLESILATD